MKVFYKDSFLRKTASIPDEVLLDTNTYFKKYPLRQPPGIPPSDSALSMECRASPARIHSKQDEVVPVRQDFNSLEVLSVTVRQDLIFEHNNTDYCTLVKTSGQNFIWLQLQTLDGE
jgi:hypothetical protein